MADVDGIWDRLDRADTGLAARDARRDAALRQAMEGLLESSQDGSTDLEVVGGSHTGAAGHGEPRPRDAAASPGRVDGGGRFRSGGGCGKKFCLGGRRGF